MLTGIKSFDDLLVTGIPKGSAIVVEGPPGIGKTTFGIQYLYEGIRTYDEAGVFITFEELSVQIYRDMMQYGWDLRELEGKNQLRVISMNPKTFLRELLKPQGLIETILRQIGCKRVVIDSISLFKYGYEEEHVKRDMIYSIHNAFSKFGMTVLYLREHALDATGIPFIHFIMDGVIQLSYQNGLEHSRFRSVEIKKLRGTQYIEGQHIYRMTQQGVQVLKTKRIPQKLSQEDVITTGIPSLDYYLGGGVKKGSMFLFDVDSKSSSRELMTSIIASRIKAGENFMYRLSPWSQIAELELLMNRYDLSLRTLAENGRAILYEQFGRTMPAEFQDVVTHLKNIENDDYLRFILQHSNLANRVKQGESWFNFYDINASIAGRGRRFILKVLPQIISFQKELNLTTFVLCNSKQIDEDMLAVLERSSDGVIRMWTEEYDFLKIDKSPNGLVSEALVLERMEEAPFIQIL